MRVVLRLDGQPGGERACVAVDGANHVLPEGKCPACSAIPWRVSGGPSKEVDDHACIRFGRPHK